jgi:hypothetical protein
MSIPSGSLVKWGGASLRKQQVARYRYTKGEWSPSAGSIMPETVPLDLTVVSWNLGYFQGISKESQGQVQGKSRPWQSLGSSKGEREKRIEEADEVARAVVIAIRKHLRGRRKSSVSSFAGPNSGINNASKGGTEISPINPTSPTSFQSVETPPSQGTIILLQQVHHVLFAALLRIDYLRENFRVIPGRIEQSSFSSASDESNSEDSFAGLWPSSSPFGNVTLISRKLSVCQANSFVFHNSIARRNALIVDLEMYDPELVPPVPPKPPSVTTLGRSNSISTSPTSPTFSPSVKPETSISGKGIRRPSVSSTASSSRSQKVVRVINAHLEPSILSKGSDKETRKDQILLVKGCLSELGLYAAIGTASVGHVEEKWFRSGRNGPGEPVGGEKSYPNGASGDNSHPKQEERIETPEEVTLARKLWARGPVGLENPHEITLRAALHCSKTEKGSGGTLAVGVGIAHHVRVT